MPHLILLGDSIFDNGSYTAGGPAVIDHVRANLPGGWRATLLAQDGSLVGDLPAQIARIPADATHLFVSCGGNNAIEQSTVLFGRDTGTAAEIVQRLADIRAAFAQSYRQALGALAQRGLPTALCTVYDPHFADPLVQQLCVAGLTLFNDAILRTAFAAGLPVIDLRLVCTAPEDYANEIEPSAAGGAKIAQAILRAAAGHDFAAGRSAVYC
jgi:hypothetical protein